MAMNVGDLTPLSKKNILQDLWNLCSSILDKQKPKSKSNTISVPISVNQGEYRGNMTSD